MYFFRSRAIPDRVRRVSAPFLTRWMVSEADRFSLFFLENADFDGVFAVQRPS
jgi:hypothetical protein